MLSIVSLQDCTLKCQGSPSSCSSTSLPSAKPSSGGLWSRDRRQNPFAAHFKVLLPSCTSDEFSGTRAASQDGTAGLHFHGRHVFAAMLRDLVKR